MFARHRLLSAEKGDLPRTIAKYLLLTLSGLQLPPQSESLQSDPTNACGGLHSTEILTTWSNVTDAVMTTNAEKHWSRQQGHN